MTTPLKLSQIPTSYDHASVAPGDQFPLVHVAGPTDGLITLSEIVVGIQYRTGATLGAGVDNTVWADSGGYVGYNPADSYTSLKQAVAGSHADSGGKCFGPNSHANTTGKAEGSNTVAMLGGTTAACASGTLAVGAAVFNQNCLYLNTTPATQAFGDYSIGIGNSQTASGWITSNYSMALGTTCQAGPNTADLDQIGGAWTVRNSGSGAGTARMISFYAQTSSLLPQFNPDDVCLLFNGTPNSATTLNGKRVTIADTIDSTGNAGAFDLAWQGAYSGSHAYNFADGVSDGTNAYACIQAATGQTPSTSPAYWELLGPDDGSGTGTNYWSLTHANSQITTCMVMTAAFADYNCVGGGTSSDLVNISQFSYHCAIGINATASDKSQQYGISNCMAVGIQITNSLPNSVLFGFDALASNNYPRGVLLCDATGVKVSYKNAKLGGTIADHYADAGTPNSTVETDLYSDTLGATNTLLDTNGDKITARYAGILVNSTSTKEVKLYFAGHVLLDTGALTMTGSGSFDINVLIIRVSVTTFRYIAECTLSGTATVIAPQYGVVTGLNLGNSQILKITGQSGGTGTAANDVVAKIATVKWEGAA